MSAFVLGKDLLASLKIFGFEFVRGYVLKGLVPHSDQGQPYRPAEIVYDFVAGLEQELAQHDELAWNLTGKEREEYITTHIDPLHERIQNYRAYLDCIQDFNWPELGLPHDYELAVSFIERLVNSYYAKAEIIDFLPWPVKPAEEPKPATNTSEPSKLKHNQERKLKCRNIAKRLWELDPLLTIADMIKRPEIVENSKKLNGNPYSEKTIRDWIKCLCPNRRPGRRSSKKPKRVSMAY
jgi:hypothetical protein